MNVQCVFIDYDQLKSVGKLVAIYPGIISSRYFDPLF